jgi:hypothetical protein
VKQVGDDLWFVKRGRQGKGKRSGERARVATGASEGEEGEGGAGGSVD